MKIFCAPKDVATVGQPDLRYVLYDYSPDPAVGSVGQQILRGINTFNMRPAQRAWDLLSIALSVIGADEACSRDQSADGWCRDIDLTVAVSDIDFWTYNSQNLIGALRFLTTDRWNISFVPNGLQPDPAAQYADQPESAVCLLSGGADSLIGAVDLRAANQNPLLVSQVAKGDKSFQIELGQVIGGNDSRHLQLNHNASPPPGFSERSQRARSLIFITYGVLAATSLDRYRAGETVDLYIPENGFISLNIPLTPLRLASHSTRTTHPYFIAQMQNLLTVAGLNVRLLNPYQMCTKGEMLVGCSDQDTLRRYVGRSTSCGRFARNAFKQCGRCVPCLIRRAAFHKWGEDPTSVYRYSNDSQSGSKFRDYDDVRSVAVAIETVRKRGLDSWIGGALNSAQLGDTSMYRAVADRGIHELQLFMQSVGVL